jgi:hypothetical protein
LRKRVNKAWDFFGLGAGLDASISRKHSIETAETPAMMRLVIIHVILSIRNAACTRRFFSRSSGFDWLLNQVIGPGGKFNWAASGKGDGRLLENTLGE